MSFVNREIAIDAIVPTALPMIAATCVTSWKIVVKALAIKLNMAVCCLNHVL
jgi:hypothetical protein